MTETVKTDELLNAINEKDKRAVLELATHESITETHLRTAITNLDQLGGISKLLSNEAAIVNTLMEKADPKLAQKVSDSRGFVR